MDKNIKLKLKAEIDKTTLSTLNDKLSSETTAGLSKAISDGIIKGFESGLKTGSSDLVSQLREQLRQLKSSLKLNPEIDESSMGKYSKLLSQGTEFTSFSSGNLITPEIVDLYKDYNKELETAIALQKKQASEAKKAAKETEDATRIEAQARGDLSNAIKAVDNTMAVANNNLKNSNKIMKNSAVEEYTGRLEELNDELNKAKSMEENSTKAVRQKTEVIRDVRNKLQKYNRDLRQSTKDNWDFGKAVKEQVKNLGTYLTASKIINTVIQLLKVMVKEVVALDKAFTNLQMVTGYNTEQMRTLKYQYTQMAQQLKATVTEVAEGADQWLRMGLSINEANKALKASIVFAKISGTTTSEATQSLISAMRGYGLEADNLMEIVDKLSAVDLASASSAKGLATSMSEVASVAKNAGVSMDKLIGYIATITEITQDSAERVGNSLRSIFTRLQNVKLGQYLSEEGEDISDVEKILSEYGIKLRDSANEWRNMGDVLDEIGGKWEKFTSVQKSAIAVTIAGKNQMNSFVTLMNNYTKASELATIATEANGTAMEKYGAYTDSVEAKLNNLKATFSELAQDTLDSDLVKFLIDVVTWVLKLTDSLGGLIPVTMGVISTIKLVSTTIRLHFALVAQSAAKAAVMTATSAEMAAKATEMAAARIAVAGTVAQVALGVVGLVASVIVGVWSAIKNAHEEEERAFQQARTEAKEAQKTIDNLRESYLKLAQTTKELSSNEEAQKNWEELYELAKKYNIEIDKTNKSLEYYITLSRKTKAKASGMAAMYDLEAEDFKEVGKLADIVGGNIGIDIEKRLQEAIDKATSENEKKTLESYKDLAKRVAGYLKTIYGASFVGDNESVLKQYDELYAKIYTMSQTEAKKNAKAALTSLTDFINEAKKKQPEITEYLDQLFTDQIKYYTDVIEAIPETFIKTIDKLTENANKAQKAYEDLKAQREEQLKLEEKILAVQEKQKALAEAERKRVKVYRAGKGFVYESDFAGVSSAQKELTKAQQDLDDYKAGLKFDKEKQEIQDLDNAFEQLFKNDEKFRDFVNSVGLETKDLGDSVESVTAKIKELISQFGGTFEMTGDTTHDTQISEGKKYFETHHKGGVVGSSDSVYTGGNLKSDEVIAKLQKGETVLTRQGTNNLVKNFITKETNGSNVVNVGNVTLPNVSNAEQFVNELKSIGRMSLQRTTSHK